VYRRRDEGVDASKNVETFAEVERALAAGDAVCVFPEGISHSTGRLEPLRTGAARMALGAERRGVSIAIVPVGLNFDRKTVFRSRVAVVYGRPFSCADLRSGPDDAAAVRTLTDRIAGHMRRLLIEADPAGDAALVDRVDRLYAAARGEGAACNGQPMRVSATVALDEATVECGWSTRRSTADYVALIGRVLGAGCAIMRAGSGALGLADVAAGRLEAYCELHINAWDCAAGILLVREAGGFANDFFAGDGLARGNPLLATNAALCDKLAAVVGIPIKS
jgi:hypothetical protein